jgi:hypothetical protein
LGSQTSVSNSAGRFTDAPVGIYYWEAFNYSGTQGLRAISPSGKVVKLGTNNVKVSANQKGDGTIVIDNKKMKIHLEVPR